jgi:hypothetical protein
MARWNRVVDLSTKGGNHLFVLRVDDPQNPGSNPPPIPGKDPRTDDANNITVYAEDRGQNGAKIHYRGNGCYLTGLEAKEEGGSLPEYKPEGGNIMITDTGAEGTCYEYYIVGRGGLKTKDPQIHNSGD